MDSFVSAALSAAAPFWSCTPVGQQQQMPLPQASHQAPQPALVASLGSMQIQEQQSAAGDDHRPAAAAQQIMSRQQQQQHAVRASEVCLCCLQHTSRNSQHHPFA